MGFFGSKFEWKRGRTAGTAIADICLKLIFMSDNKHNKGKQDDIRVDANDPSEVEYLHRKFPDKSHAEIKEAIKQAGPLRADIIALLNGK